MESPVFRCHLTRIKNSSNSSWTLVFCFCTSFCLVAAATACFQYRLICQLFPWLIFYPDCSTTYPVCVTCWLVKDILCFNGRAAANNMFKSLFGVFLGGGGLCVMWTLRFAAEGSMQWWTDWPSSLSVPPEVELLSWNSHVSPAHKSQAHFRSWMGFFWVSAYVSSRSSSACSTGLFLTRSSWGRAKHRNVFHTFIHVCCCCDATHCIQWYAWVRPHLPPGFLRVLTLRQIQATWRQIRVTHTSQSWLNLFSPLFALLFDERRHNPVRRSASCNLYCIGTQMVQVFLNPAEKLTSLNIVPAYRTCWSGTVRVKQTKVFVHH